MDVYSLKLYSECTTPQASGSVKLRLKQNHNHMLYLRQISASYEENVRGHAALMGRIRRQWFAQLPSGLPKRPPHRVCNEYGVCWTV